MKTKTGGVLLLIALFPILAHAQSPEGTWHGERAGVKFHPSGENIAYDKPAATVHPKLTEHSQKMVPGVYQVAESVYLAYGYALTSPAMIVGDDGVIIVDPPEDVKQGPPDAPGVPTILGQAGQGGDLLPLAHRPFRWRGGLRVS
jgi:hypothetical protein